MKVLNKGLYLLLAALMLLVVSCTGSDVKEEEHAEEEHAHWSYEGETGPEHWISGGFCDEGIGAEQSPIDIPAGAAVHSADIEFNYSAFPLTVVNNGHAIQVNCDGNSTISVEGSEYELLQFHFHALSEHTVAGEYADMEVHFVHKNAEGQLAVVGILMNVGAENAALAGMFDNITATVDEVVEVEAEVNGMDVLPAAKEYYRYNGSLTTPPCSEGVKWFLMKDAIEISEEQLAKFTAVYSNNYRPVQPMNDRVFIVD